MAPEAAVQAHAAAVSASDPGLLLVGHGSRDADGVEEFWELARHIQDAAGEVPVECGFIEMAQPLIDDAIDKLVPRAPRGVVSVPLVLLAAGHLKNDGPAALARARSRHPGVDFRLARDLGIDPAVLSVAEDRIREAIGEDDPEQVAVVLVGRGSSDPDAGGDLYKVARLLADGRGLGTIEPAFAGVAQPDVPAALERCRLLGAETIVVVPFFLFTGILVPRIYRQAGEWASRHPGLTVRGGPHLGPDRRFARLVLERYREAIQGEVRMNCDLCTYRVRLPGYEDKVGTPISLTPHGEGPARGRRRVRRATRAPQPAPPIALSPRRPGLRPAHVSAASDGPPAVEVRGLAFDYPDGTPALGGLDLVVRKGERVAILGPNGAGKTTLALNLNGMLEGARGEVIVSGIKLSPDMRQEVRRRVGIVFQDSDDQLFMPTVGADVAFGPANLGLEGEALQQRVAEALERVRMEDEIDRAPHQLSAGQRRRAAVAGILAMHPDVLVLDEPSSALDPAARRELADVVQSLRLTTLVITHDLPYALELCPRTVVLDRGVVVADGPTREVLSDEGFMSSHRLELPAGFNPLTA
jgi:cobalt transport protein ATP-binding subunit